MIATEPKQPERLGKRVYATRCPNCYRSRTRVYCTRAETGERFCKCGDCGHTWTQYGPPTISK